MRLGLESRVVRFFVVSICLLSPAEKPLVAQEEEAAISPEVREAIDKGIAFLVSKQRDNGAIADRQYETTMSSLAIMALASTGVTPSSPGEFGQVSRRALDFVLSKGRQDDEGYFGNRDGSRMYGHGITTLMLTEMIGMGASEQQDALIHLRCQRAIDLILSAQKQQKSSSYSGGWRYTPNSNDADLSVSVWQLMALRSAKNDDLDVPTESINDAIAYLERSFSSKLDSQGNPLRSGGGFCYLPKTRNPTFAMTAAGLLAMQVCGEYDSPLVRDAALWLEEHPPSGRIVFSSTEPTTTHKACTNAVVGKRSSRANKWQPYSSRSSKTTVLGLHPVEKSLAQAKSIQPAWRFSVFQSSITTCQSTSDSSCSGQAGSGVAGLSDLRSRSRYMVDHETARRYPRASPILRFVPSNAETQEPKRR